jgi:DNA repair exonuclease SbcCD ATPase subunit
MADSRMGATSKTCRAILAGLLLIGLVGAAPARADQSDAETRLRAALKSATARIRDLEEQNATLTAKQADADRDKQAMTQKAAEDDKALADLHKQTDADKAALDQATTTQHQQQDSIAKWQASYNEAADTARTRDADAKQLDTVLKQMRPDLQSCEAKNAALYKIGEDVLDLYDKKDFFDLVTREPITKLKRVELENTIQDYEDKLRDNKITEKIK